MHACVLLAHARVCVCLCVGVRASMCLGVVLFVVLLLGTEGGVWVCSRCGCAGVLIIVICYCMSLALSCSAIGQAHHKMLTPLCQMYVAFVGTGLKRGWG